MTALAHFLKKAAFSLILLGALLPAVRAADIAALDAVLAAHVKNGHADYASIQTDQRLTAYLASLAELKPDALPSRNEQLAFWINAYNAFTLKLVTDHYPVKSIRDIPHPGLPSTWDLPVALIGGRTYTLNEIEHVIIRPTFKEPRVHFALVCAAVSCPPLRAESYSADRLDAQLSDQARLFLAAKNRFDATERRAELSSIFNWFATDFGDKPAALLAALAPYAPVAVQKSLETNPGQWSITYLDYDWALNDRLPNP